MAKFRYKKRKSYHQKFKIPIVHTRRNSKNLPIITYRLSSSKVPSRSIAINLFRMRKSPIYDWYYGCENRIIHSRKYLNQSFARLCILVKRRNTFINALIGPKFRKVLAAISTGMLGYTGRQKGSQFARQAVGEQMANFVLRSNHRFCSILFLSKLGKIYKNILKGFARKRLIIHMFLVKHIHAHGSIRAKKIRRK